MSTAAEKIRITLTGSPSDEPSFQHEGAKVTRWITGGTLPDLYVTFHQRGSEIEVRCSTCNALLGTIPSSFGEEAAQKIVVMRQSGHQH